MKKQYFVYIITNKRNTVLYTGVTSNLENRIYQHKHKLIEGFTSRYNVNKLVYYEIFNDIQDALMAEKRIKGWVRRKKIELIKSCNPDFDDLSEDVRDSSVAIAPSE